MESTLALDILQNEFGSVVYAIGKALIENGPMTLKELFQAGLVVDESENAGGNEFGFNFNSSNSTSNTMDLPTLKSGLIIMLKHSLVKMESYDGTFATRDRITYAASVNHMLFILQYPRILTLTFEICSDELAQVPVVSKSDVVRIMIIIEILKEFMVHGLQHSEYAIKAVTKRFIDGNVVPIKNFLKLKTDTERENVDQEMVSEAFNTMVYQKFLVEQFELTESRSKAPETNNAKLGIYGSTKVTNKRKRTATTAKNIAKKAKTVTISETVQTIVSDSNHGDVSRSTTKNGGATNGSSNVTLIQSLELKMRLKKNLGSKKDAASRRNGSSFNSPILMLPDVKSEVAKTAKIEVETVYLKSEIKSSNPANKAEVHQNKFLNSDAPLANDACYRLNINHFLSLFRMNHMRTYLSEKLGSSDIKHLGTAAVEGSMLRVMYDDFDDFLLPDESLAISVDSLLEYMLPDLEANFAGEERAALNIFVETLASDSHRIIELHRVLDDASEVESIRLNFENIMDDLRQNCLVNMIRTQLGVESARIILLLLEKHALEEKQIGDFTLIPQREVRKYIFNLMRKGLLKWEEAPKKSDFNPKTTIHLWSVDLNNVISFFSELSYQAILNLRIRNRVMGEANEELNRFEIYESDKYDESTRRQIPGMWRYRKFKAAMITLDETALAISRTSLLLNVL